MNRSGEASGMVRGAAGLDLNSDLDAIAVRKRFMLGAIKKTAGQVATLVEDFNQFSTAGDATTFGGGWIRTVGGNSSVTHRSSGGPAGGIADITSTLAFEENSLILNGPGFPSAGNSWAVNFRVFFALPGANALNNMLLGICQGSTGTLAGITSGHVLIWGYAGGTSTVDVVWGPNQLTTYPLASLDGVWHDVTLVSRFTTPNSFITAYIDGTAIDTLTVVNSNYSACNPFLYCNRGELRCDTIIAMWEREK